MTIKKHGGIFGRNPSFNDASVQTLSIGGTAISSTAAELNILDGVTSNTAELNILDGVTSTTAELNILDGVTADATELNYLDGASTSVVTASKAVLANASANIAFASGQGIDFSATAGTGTSELFSDYEEGTFTPSYSAATGTFTTLIYTSQQGYYTKIGNVVTFFIYIQTANVNVGSASGELQITGLPYTSASASPLDSYAGFGATIFSRRWALAADIQNLSGIGVRPNSTNVQLQKTTMNTASVGRVQVSDLTTGAAASRNSLGIAGHYYVP